MQKLSLPITIIILFDKIHLKNYPFPTKTGNTIKKIPIVKINLENAKNV